MSIQVNDENPFPWSEYINLSTLRPPDSPFLTLTMADHDALSLFYNESKQFTRAIEEHLVLMAMYVLRE